MKKLAAVVLFLLSTSTALAAEGRLTITNNGSRKIRLYSYNSDDTVRLAFYGELPLETNQQGTIHCKTALGCQIRIIDDDADLNQGTLIDHTYKNTGTYALNGSWDLDSSGFLGTKKVTNVSVTLALAQGDPGDEVSFDRAGLPNPLGGLTDCVDNQADRTLADNRKVLLKFQTDGNLIVSNKSNGGSLWASNTNGSGADRICFQGDGNLVLYNGGNPVWATGTVNSGDTLKLQTDCNLVIYDAGGGAKWATGTICP